jgi:hypothetical protein
MAPRTASPFRLPAGHSPTDRQSEQYVTVLRSVTYCLSRPPQSQLSDIASRRSHDGVIKLLDEAAAMRVSHHRVRGAKHGRLLDGYDVIWHQPRQEQRSQAARITANTVAVRGAARTKSQLLWRGVDAKLPPADGGDNGASHRLPPALLPLYLPPPRFGGPPASLLAELDQSGPFFDDGSNGCVDGCRFGLSRRRKQRIHHRDGSARGLSGVDALVGLLFVEAST